MRARQVHRNTRVYQVGNEVLSVHDILMRTGLSRSCILYRLAHGVTGLDLLAAAHSVGARHYAPAQISDTLPSHTRELSDSELSEIEAECTRVRATVPRNLWDWRFTEIAARYETSPFHVKNISKHRKWSRAPRWITLAHPRTGKPIRVTVAQIAATVGVTPITIHKRLERGVTGAALFAPKNAAKRKKRSPVAIGAMQEAPKSPGREISSSITNWHVVRPGELFDNTDED